MAEAKGMEIKNKKLDSIKNRKSIIIIIIAIGILLFVGYRLFNFANYRSPRTEIKHDISIITNRFPVLSNKIESCYIKADTLGNINIGPSSYWIVSFVVLNEDGKKMICDKYNFENISPQFSKLLLPNVTEKNDFEWKYSEDLQNDLLGSDFIGKVYYDLKNSILYFDIERM